MNRKTPGPAGVGNGPQKLFAWRERTKTSRPQLVKLMGLKHGSSIYHYEAGLLPWPFPRLLDLQRITGISIWALAWPEQREVMRAIVRSPRLTRARAGGEEAGAA